MKKFETNVCAICGGGDGIHQSETMRCPEWGREEIREGFQQKWNLTTFTDSGLKLLTDKAQDLYEAVIHLQKRLEFLINLTPSGVERDMMTLENIKAMELIDELE